MKKVIKKTVGLFLFASIVLLLTSCNHNVDVIEEIKDVTAPGMVTDLNAKTGSNQIILSWQEPKDNDLNKIIILQDNKVIKEIKKGISEVVVDGLINGRKYTFVVKAVDRKGNISEPCEISQYAMFDLTTKPKKINTKNINGTDFDIVIFGDFPQTVKNSKVKLSEDMVKVNSFDCYYGDDGYYYTKVKVVFSQNTSSNHLYSDESYNNSGEYNYFKIEPIEWRVLTNNYKDANNEEKGSLLFAEKALTASMYNLKIKRNINNKNVLPSNYEYSRIRAYLNGFNGDSYSVDDFSGRGFLQQAFSSESVKLINNIRLYKDATSLSDKVFLLSNDEVVLNDYGFKGYNQDEALWKTTTDYSIATGAWSTFKRSGMDPKRFRNACYLLRPRERNYNYYKVFDVMEYGYVRDYTSNLDFPDSSVVPAIVISTY